MVVEHHGQDFRFPFSHSEMKWQQCTLLYMQQCTRPRVQLRTNSFHCSVIEATILTDKVGHYVIQVRVFSSLLMQECMFVCVYVYEDDNTCTFV